jgi:hypothetical protein
VALRDGWDVSKNTKFVKVYPLTLLGG